MGGYASLVRKKNELDGWGGVGWGEVGGCSRVWVRRVVRKDNKSKLYFIIYYLLSYLYALLVFLNLQYLYIDTYTTISFLPNSFNCLRRTVKRERAIPKPQDIQENARTLEIHALIFTTYKYHEESPNT